MNAETGTEPEAPKKRGRIPQSAWPQILERYRSGATLSAIAREFECTPSAISYIIRKAEAAGATGDDAGAQPADEAASPEAAPVEAVVSEAAPAESAPPAPQPAARERRVSEPKPDAPKPDAKPAESKGEERRPTVTAAAPATETLRLNRPEAQPAPTQPTPVAAAPAPAPAAPATAATPSAGGRGEPAAPVDAVEARLRETARGCLSAYRGWRQQPGETSIQALSDAVHELRKALARIEIDMSASRREEQAIRPIPIPAHRAARRTQ